MKAAILIVTTLFVLICCVPIDQGKSTAGNQSYPSLVMSDHNYSNTIKTVQLYSDNNQLFDQVTPAVTHISQSNLKLEFDDLKVDADIFRAKILNCTSNWQQSSLSPMDYLYEFNEFEITDYEFSLGTIEPYVHYQFRIPKIKLSGNYVIVVYRGTNPRDVILSRRFMVYESKVAISPVNEISGIANLSKLNQQIEFTIDYSDYEIINPLATVKVHIRQNQRWDNMVSDIKPSFIREDLKELEYRFFNSNNNFASGNEFRFYDLRSLLYPGQNILNVKEEMGKKIVSVTPNRPRNEFAYSQYNDYNGNYIIDSRDGGDPKFSSEYNKVKFTLNSNKLKHNGDVYVFGALTDWKTSEANKMQYNEASRSYTADLLLKQGFYNFSYYFKSDSINYNYIEGNYLDTENEYEIFVYYRPYNSRTDLLVGYLQLQRNRRLNR